MLHFRVESIVIVVLLLIWSTLMFEVLLVCPLSRILDILYSLLKTFSYDVVVSPKREVRSVQCN